jgi:polysaccharide deacetylase 2 family uncharacterized protein YibQ
LPKPVHTGVLSTLAALLLLMAPLPSPATQPQAFLQKQPQAFIAIIIDDIGHSRARAERMFEIPAPLTFAIIPETTFAEPLARQAYLSGKEVMIHLPMENSLNRPMESLQLNAEHNQLELELILDKAVAQIPYATGVNNHMGSTLTQMPQAMSWLMRSIRKHKMYFIDSRTTHKSVAHEIARQESLLSASRDVFLDNDQSLYAVDQQFQKLLKVARHRKTAIAIGHPYPVTTDYLARAIPQMEERGIKVVSVTDLLRIRSESLTEHQPEHQVAGLFSAVGAD